MGLRDFLLPTPELQMGPQAIQFRIPFSPNCHGRFGVYNRLNSRTNSWRCFSGGRSGGSRWDWEKNVNPKRKSRFSDAYATDDYDEEVEFGFRNVAKQRIWWHDEVDAEDDDDEEEEEDKGLGILEASIGFDWVFKVLQAFAWTIPAVVISVMTGTGSHSIIMALALPLAQTAFSLAADTLFGRPNKRPRSKSKRKKRPFAGVSGRTRVRREKRMHTERPKEAGHYKSWVDNFSANNAESNQQNFGGWDELDNQARVDKNPHIKNTDETRAQEGVKNSRRRNGNAPLF